MREGRDDFRVGWIGFFWIILVVWKRRFDLDSLFRGKIKFLFLEKEDL